MPVTFLRTPADYFGIQEAPAQPLFQQTRALADPAVQNQLGFMDKVTQLRQQRPLARAQAMQNEYDTIFANADRLRMQQEAAKQAEQAVSALAGLTPEADDYITQRQQIQQQFPSAMLDPRVQRIVDDNDRVFGARQSAIAKQQAEREGLTAELTEAGMTDLNEAARIAGLGRPAVGAAKYQLGRKPEQDQSIAMRKEEIDMLSRRLNQLTKDDMAEIPTGKDANGNPIYGPNPEYVNLAKELKDREDELRGIYRGVYAPETVKKQAATTSAAPPPQAESQVAFKERMKVLAGGQPKEQIIAPVKDDEILAALNSPGVDENTFIAATTSPSTSLEVKKQALEKLRQFAKEPKFPAGTTVMQAKERLGAINDKIAEAERAVRMEPERQKLNQAWTQEKSQMAIYIKDFAKSLGLKPDLVENSLAINELTDPNTEYPVTIRAEFDAFLRNKKGVKGNFLDMQADKLLPFTGSEFAGDFGMEGFIPGFRSFGKGKTYGDVLDAYLAEKVPTSAASPQNQVAQPTPTLNVKNVRVKPPEQP